MASIDNNTKKESGKIVSETGGSSKTRRGIVITAVISALAVLAALIFGVFVIISAVKEQKNIVDETDKVQISEAGSVDNSTADIKQENSDNKMLNDKALFDINRQSFIAPSKELYNKALVPCVEEFKVNSDLSNVCNYEDFSFQLSDEMIKALVEDGFFVDGSQNGYNEFFDIYELNRYNLEPNFITVDSLMHTYHLYFAFLLKNTEKNYLYDDVANITSKMFDESVRQYDLLKGTEFESAAQRNVEFFSVASKLMGLDKEVPQYAKEYCDEEYYRILAAEGIDMSPISKVYEDYSQYKPRGYYEGDSTLEKYFRTMMWYGRISFKQIDEDMDRSALLMVNGIRSSCFDEWESVYLVTSFFSGESDDCTFYDYIAASDDAYGEIAEIAALAGDKESFDRYRSNTSSMQPPHINSIPVNENEDNVIVSYRFMGQRFSIDEAVFANLTYRNVEENAFGERRYLPDTLDVAAALGSQAAYDILNKNGDTDYKNYDKNLDVMKQELQSSDESLWNSSLYSCWLNTLRPLLEEKKEGYPKYMQSSKWTLKDIETFAGSYAELKHDTILYSKQNMAEMGGGDIEEKDDRGYVDPEPVVYSRFANLANATKEGLDKYGMLSSKDKDNLDILYDMSVKLLTISEKELVNEILTDEEYEFIRCYGGDLEHFWLEVNKNDEYNMTYSDQSPCPIIADISTDPNGSILEVGTGNASKIYVLINVDGKIKIATGSAYSFYQFVQPMSEGRLTDSEWRKMISGFIDDNYNYNEPQDIERPKWTTSYRYTKVWDW